MLVVLEMISGFVEEAVYKSTVSTTRRRMREIRGVIEEGVIEGDGLEKIWV